MLTLGGVQAISLATRAFLDAGDTIAVEAPTWGAALNAARNAGAEAIAVPMDAEGMRRRRARAGARAPRRPRAAR